MKILPREQRIPAIAGAAFVLFAVLCTSLVVYYWKPAAKPSAKPADAALSPQNAQSSPKAASPTESRRAKLARIKIGMSPKEVDAIMGESDSYINEGDGTWGHRFRFAGGRFAPIVLLYADEEGSEFGIGFDDSGVVGKGGFDAIPFRVGKAQFERRGK